MRFMKKMLFAAIPVAVISLLTMKKMNEPLPIGSPIPNAAVKMKDISGTDVSFADVKTDKGLVVMFSCNTCPVVKKYQSRTLEVCKYAMGNGLGVILLNSNEATRNDGDSYNDMKAYAAEQHYFFKYVIDNHSAMADAFGANRTPEVYIFDKNGKLAYHGAIDDNSNSPEEVTRKHAIIAIDEMNAGRDVTQKVTRSVGCGIKRL
jgi:hypothetical protein